jgi:hypothetical protein
MAKPPPLCPLCQTLAAGYTYQHPRVTVAQDERDGVVRLSVDWGTWSWHRDVRPASLLELEHPHENIADVYELVDSSEDHLAYRIGNGVRPMPGHSFVLSVWWTPDAVEAIDNPQTDWQYKKWISDEDHDHCWLCAATIGAGSDPSLWEGYQVEGRFRWVCPSCYTLYVEHGPAWARR